MTPSETPFIATDGSPAGGPAAGDEIWHDGAGAGELAEPAEMESPDAAWTEAFEADPESFEAEPYEHEQEASDDGEAGEVELGEVEGFLAELSGGAAEREAETAASSVRFPSGVELPVIARTVPPTSEHHDPNGSGNPLLDTGHDKRALRLSANFTVAELARSGGQSFDMARIDPSLVRCLEALRHRVGKPVRITSGYRPHGYNAALYKARGQTPTASQHSSGRAADLKIAGMTGTDIAKAAIDACGGLLGIGVGGDFAHVDVRGRPATWTYFRDQARSAAALGEIRAHRRLRAATGGEVPTSSAERPDPTTPVASASPEELDLLPVGPRPSPADLYAWFALSYSRAWKKFKTDLVDIARSEHAFWGGRKESVPALLGRLQDYFRASGLAEADVVPYATRSAGDDPLYAWSAPFISSVVQQAERANPGSAGKFQRSARHAVYIRAAKRNRANNDALNPFWLFDLGEKRPEPGDLLCKNRRHKTITFGAIPADKFAAHVDIVISVDPANNRLTTIGGNVTGNTVGERTVPTVDGFVTVNSTTLAKGRYFAVLRVRTDLMEGVVTNPT